VKIKVTKEPDDPICPRASIGGTKEIGYYCIYRGEATAILNILKHVIRELESKHV
jgi:hypothetical protein